MCVCVCVCVCVVLGHRLKITSLFLNVLELICLLKVSLNYYDSFFAHK